MGITMDVIMDIMVNMAAMETMGITDRVAKNHRKMALQVSLLALLQE